MLHPPRPWHLILAPTVPLLALLGTNLAVSPPFVIVRPALVAIPASVVLWLALVPLSRDAHRAAIAATVLVLLGMSQGMLGAMTEHIGAPWIVPVVCAAGILASVRLLRSGQPAVAVTAFANRAFLIAVVLLVGPMVWSEVRRDRATVEPFGIKPAQSGVRPDVYVIVLDAYAREDVLRELYRVETGLATELRGLGFTVASRATANYAHTALSMASALNGEYLPAVGFPTDPSVVTRRGLADVIAGSRFFSAFHAAGYRIRAYRSEYSMLRPAEAHERPAPFGYLDEFGLAAVEATFVPTLAGALGFGRAEPGGSLHRRQVAWTLDHLATEAPADGSPPMLVFAHVLAPHPPFVFDAHGGARRTRMRALMTDADYWREEAAATGERYEDGYADSVRALDPRVARAVRAITARRRPAIVLVHGDHGPGSRLHWDDVAATDLRERLGILLALRFPGGEAPPIDADTTLVNAYRAVLNRALGTALPPLEDRAYFSSWEAPFAYVDVTGSLECDPCGDK